MEVGYRLRWRMLMLMFILLRELLVRSFALLLSSTTRTYAKWVGHSDNYREPMAIPNTPLHST